MSQPRASVLVPSLLRNTILLLLRLLTYKERLLEEDHNARARASREEEVQEEVFNRFLLGVNYNTIIKDCDIDAQ